jgi:hypothetical protein
MFSRIFAASEAFGQENVLLIIGEDQDNVRLVGRVRGC